MTNLADLPGLGKPGPAAGPKFREEDSGGFDDFDFEEDHIGDSSNKFDEAEKQLRDFYKEENEGFKLGSGSLNEKNKRGGGFKVSIGGLNKRNEDDDDIEEEEIIEEDIQTDREE